jgi:hypothetical protein
MDKEIKFKSNLLETYEKTVLKVIEFSQKYSSDCLFLINKTPLEVFEFIKNLPYKADPKGIEFVSRPEYSIWRKDLPRDCDDKTLIAICYFELKNIPYRIIISGRDIKPHHIYSEFLDNLKNTWIPFDATYQKNIYGKVPYVEKFRKIFYPLKK